jgi:hypothetical protein
MWLDKYLSETKLKSNIFGHTIRMGMSWPRPTLGLDTVGPEAKLRGHWSTHF